MLKLAIAKGSREEGSHQPAAVIYRVPSPSNPVLRPHRTLWITCAAPSLHVNAGCVCSMSCQLPFLLLAPHRTLWITCAAPSLQAAAARACRACW